MALCFFPFVVACNLEGRGFPSDEFFFPQAIAGSADGQLLTVGNSNFELKYREGSLLLLDLTRTLALEANCILGLEASGHTDRSQCQVNDLAPLVIDQRPIGSYISKLLMRDNALFAAIKGSRTLLKLNVSATDGFVACTEEPCPIDALELESEPTDMALQGDTLITALQSGKLVLSNLQQTWLSDVQTGIANLTSVHASPGPQGQIQVWSGGAPTNRNTAFVHQSFVSGTQISTSRTLSLRDIDDGTDVRDLDTYGNHLLVLSRRPEALLFVSHLGEIETIVRTGFGTSVMTQAKVDGRDMLFIACYDARAVYVVDLSTRALVDIVAGFSGPHEMWFSETHQRLFVTDFRNSQVHVVQKHPTLGYIRTLSLGAPKTPEAFR